MNTKLSSYQKLKQRLFDSEKRLYDLQKAVTDDDFKTLVKVKVIFQTARDLERAIWFGDAVDNAPHAEGILNQIVNGDQKPNI